MFRAIGGFRWGRSLLNDPSAWAPSDDEDEANWDVLLDSIQDGSLVPIVGRDLLTIGAPESPKLLYDDLGERLAKRLGVDNDVDGALDLNSVATRYILKPKKSLRDVYSSLGRIVEQLEPMQPPEPLLQLASIMRDSGVERSVSHSEPAVQMLVTTTFDGLLEKAVEEVYGKAPTVLKYWRSSRGFGPPSRRLVAPRPISLFVRRVPNREV